VIKSVACLQREADAAKLADPGRRMALAENTDDEKASIILDEVLAPLP